MPKECNFIVTGFFLWVVILMFPFQCFAQALDSQYTIFQKAKDYVNNGKYDEAIDQFNQLINAHPSDNAGYYYWRGCAYRSKKDFFQAIADYTRAVEINPHYGWAYGWMGIIYDQQKKFPEAILNFTKAIETDPYSAQFYSLRGMAYDHNDNQEQAILDYTKAVEIDPMYFLSFKSRGEDLMNEGELDKALADLNKCIEIRSNYSDAYAVRARIYFLMKEYDKSWADVDKARSFGYSIDQKFKEDLKEASGQDR